MSIFKVAVTYFLLLSSPWVLSEASVHTRECKMFGLFVARVVQKVSNKTGPFSCFVYSYFPAICQYIDHTDQLRCNKFFCRDVNQVTCDNGAPTLPNSAWHQSNMDFLKPRYHCIETSTSLAWINHGEENCLLKKAGSKWQANYTLKWNTSCSCFKIQLSGLYTLTLTATL